jgi:hypothetical protein
MNPLVILGAQESGVGAARLAQQRGLDVFVSDAGAIKPKYRDELLRLGIEFEENGHSAERVLGAGSIVKSPGIPDTASLVVAANERGIPVISEIEFAFRYCKGRIIGITGSNGKTTTTLLTHHILQSAGVDVAVGGNVGTSFAGPCGRWGQGLVRARAEQLPARWHPHIPSGHRHPAQHHAGPPGPLPVPHGQLRGEQVPHRHESRPADHFIHCADDRETRNWLSGQHP